MKMVKSFQKITLFVFAILIYSACQNSETLESKPLEKTLNVSSKSTPDQNSLIRNTDFKNFKYSSVYMNMNDLETFELKYGEKEKTDNEDGATFKM